MSPETTGFPRLESVRSRPPTDWLLALPVVATALVELCVLATVTFGSRRPPMTADAALFQHVGWSLSRGSRLYVDVWDIKLPLSYETTELLAILSGGDMLVLHLLSVLLMMGLACGIVWLVIQFTYDVTQDSVAAAVAGFSMLLLPGFFVRPAYGYKAKYPLLFAGLLAVYLYTRGWPALSGVAAAASVGYWQAALVFPCLVVGMALVDRNRKAVGRIVVGGVGCTLLTLLPVFFVWQSTSEMLVQTVLVPLVVSESTPLLTRIVAGVAHFKWASPLVLVGTAGLGLLTVDIVRDRGIAGRDAWWVPVCAAWFAFLVLFVDFEVGGYTDLIPGLAFVALGIGVVTARLDTHRLWERRTKQALVTVVAAVLVTNLVFLGSLGLVFSPVQTPDAEPMSELATNERASEAAGVGQIPDVRYIYWNQQRPPTCHYRLSLMELQWLEESGSGAGDRCLGIEEALSALRS